MPLPAKAVAEAVDRYDLGKLLAGNVFSADVEEVKAAGARLQCRLAIQRRIFSGSVRKAKTVAGGAATWTSRWTNSGSVIGSLVGRVASRPSVGEATPQFVVKSCSNARNL